MGNKERFGAAIPKKKICSTALVARKAVLRCHFLSVHFAFESAAMPTVQIAIGSK